MYADPNPQNLINAYLDPDPRTHMNADPTVSKSTSLIKCLSSGQMYLMDSFLGGEFSTYGADVIKMTGLEVQLAALRIRIRPSEKPY